MKNEFKGRLLEICNCKENMQNENWKLMSFFQDKRRFMIIFIFCRVLGRKGSCFVCDKGKRNG